MHASAYNCGGALARRRWLLLFRMGRPGRGGVVTTRRRRGVIQAASSTPAVADRRSMELHA